MYAATFQQGDARDDGKFDGLPSRGIIFLKNYGSCPEHVSPLLRRYIMHNAKLCKQGADGSRSSQGWQGCTCGDFSPSFQK